jgi:tetratricopeptide (TPR) repeat protein
MAAYQQDMGLCLAVPFWCFLRDLIGSLAVDIDLPSEIKDEYSALAHAEREKNQAAISMYYVARAIFYSLMGDYENALSMATRYHDSQNEPDIQLVFYEGLAAASVGRTAQGLKRFRLARRCRKCANQLERWARRCPANFLNKLTLLKAELEVLKGNQSKAQRLYTESIEAAVSQGFVQEEALAYERLGSYLCHVGTHRLAIPYFEIARNTYSRWGSQAMVNRMNTFLQSASK